MRSWPSLLIIGLVTGLIYNQVIFNKLPQTHDGQLQVARLAQYYLAINQGQWPPRIAPNTNNGFGYPVFNFNYPLPYILGTVLMKAQLPIETAMKTLVVMALIIAGGGMYFLLKQLVSNQASILGGIWYAASNYALLLVFVRGGIGEIWAYALIPWVFYSFKRYLMARDKQKVIWLFGSSGILGLFLIAHNIMTVFGMGLLLVYLIYQSRGLKNWTWWQPLLLASGLSWFFWLPALAEQKYTIIASTPLSSAYLQHFPTLRQLFYDAWGYGYSRPGPVDGLSYNINPLWILILIVGGILIFKLKKPAWIVWLYGIIVIWLFAILALSKAIWQILPVVNYIQFPWRLLFFLPILAIPVMVWVFDQTKRYWWVWFLILFIWGFGLAGKNKAYETFSHPDDYWFHFNGTTSTLDENMPIWFRKEVVYPLDLTLFKDHPLASPEQPLNQETSLWTGTSRKYVINTDKPVTVVERIAYFPGTEVWVNQQKTAIDYQNPAFPGLISYKLPVPGKYSVESKFTQQTWPRLIGNGITLISLLIWLGGMGYGLKLFYKHKNFWTRA